MPRNAFGPAPWRHAPCGFVVQLHVEDEFVATERHLRGGELERGLGRQHVVAAALAGGREGAVECGERGGRAEQRLQIAAAARASRRAASSIASRASAGVPRRGAERHRLEFAVGGAVELDRQSLGLRATK
jgi:hypothetical protein